MLKPSSLFKKSSKECKFIKARQLVDTCSTPPICRGLRILDFNSDFLGIREFVYGPSFLLTLDIYKMIFLRAVKRYTSCTSIEQTLFKQIVTGDKVLDLIHLSFGEVAVYLHHRVLWPSIFVIFIVWLHWRTLQPTIFSDWCFEVVYWDLRNR